MGAVHLVCFIAIIHCKNQNLDQGVRYPEPICWLNYTTNKDRQKERKKERNTSLGKQTVA